MTANTQSTQARELYGKPWSRREYILVLYYYFLHPDASHDKNTPSVIDLAAVMGRTPAAVAMRLHNFSSLDRENNKTRIGLQNIGPLGRDIFSWWRDRLDSLKIVGDEYLRDAKDANTPDLFNPEPMRLPLAFGKYEPLDELGNGGFGTVISCIDPRTNKQYAIKIIRPELVDDIEALSRFRREIGLIKAISHPNVIRIHEDNLNSEYHFPAYVMDLAEWPLRLYLDRSRRDGSVPDKKPRLPTSEAIELILEVFDGVEALHTNNPPVVHRDIKPENVLRLANGRWVIADFGLAKFLPPVAFSNSFATASKKAMGTTGYAAPEQSKDFRSADHRADIYSLGVLIWELFSPAWGQLDRSDTELPLSLEQVVLKATAKRPEERYSTVHDLRIEFIEGVKGVDLIVE